MDQIEKFPRLPVLILITILAILPLSVFFFLNARVDSHNPSIVTKRRMEELVHALDFYKMDNAFYPITRQGLGVLKPSYISNIPLDGWGHNFFYVSDGATFEIVSFGADEKTGGVQEDADIKASSFFKTKIK